MIKDVLLSLSLAASEDFTVDYAVSLAKTFGARVTGIAFAYEKVPTGILGDETWVDSVEQLRKEAEDAARAATASFEKSARDADVANEARWLSATFLGTADEFGRIARRFDLSVVRQAEPRTGTSDHLIVQAALFDSGRPVIVVPYGHTMPARFDRILVCWDGSRSAARAAADAFPFFGRAKAIEVLTVEDQSGSDKHLGAEMANHLNRHGLPAEARLIGASGMDVANRIVSHVADISADLVVMGGYGHSRLREFVLGGATRGVLAAMSIPTLMSH